MESQVALTKALAHLCLSTAKTCDGDRCELFDFIVSELKQSEHQDSARIRPVRVALERQSNNLLVFVKVLDTKLAGIAQHFLRSNLGQG